MNKDTISGLALFCVGIMTVIYTQHKYTLGSAANMGPGFFPFFLGIILAILGAIAAARSSSDGSQSDIADYQSLITITTGIGVFALLLHHAGLILAIVASVTLWTYASPCYDKFGARLLVAIVIAVINWLIFIVLLGLPIQAIPG